MARDLIQIRRGNEVDLPSLAQGEMGYTLDTKQLYVGGLSGNEEILQRDYVSVKDFGAIGDGVTDDTQAIQDAIDSLQNSGGTIYIPEGVYPISNSLKLYSNIKIIGNNKKSKIVRKNDSLSSWVIALQYIENVQVDGLHLDGGITDANPDGTDEQKHVIVCSNLVNSVISNCLIENAGGDGVYIGDNPTTHESSENVIVDKCIINQVGRNGVSFTGANYCKVLNSKISNANGPVLGVGIDIEPNENDTCIGNEVVGTIISNCLIGVTTVPKTTDRVSYGHLFNRNKVHDCERGMQCSGRETSYIDNTIVDNLNAGLYIINAEKSVFQNNTVLNNGKSNYQYGQVTITTSEDILFMGNRVTFPEPITETGAQYNLYLTSGECNNLVVFGNVLIPTKTGGNVIGKFASGDITLQANLTGGILSYDTYFDFKKSDVIRTFLYDMNFYKGIGTGEFSFRKGTPDSYTDLFTVDNNGNVQSLGSVTLQGGSVNAQYSRFTHSARPYSFEGAMYWNTTTKKLEIYDGSNWREITII